MWGSSEEPPGTMEAGPPESVANLKETCEQRKTQLESVKDIMLKNEESLKKKEEEIQEYAKKLSKFKTRAKKRSNKDDGTSSSESTPKSKSDIATSDISYDAIDDISQANTPIAKSSLLQKKLAEDRKIFEQRSKEKKKAAEEKVEALRQQLEEKYVSPVSVITPALVTPQTPQPILDLSQGQDKDHKIAELNSKIFDLEAMIIDLQENLKEKDSVIDSKMKAVTLMSADLSMKGKTTLDTLEDTKDEMRSMQENFVLVEESLRLKNDNLLKQLEDKTNQITTLEESVQNLTTKLETQKEAETVSADFSRSTMDTLADTKDAMKSMQENFVLIESSLKAKNEHLLKQLEEREIKLAEAEAKILHLESGLGIEKQPNLEDLTYKFEKLEQENRSLQDEKYQLQKSISELQNQILNSQSGNSDSLLAEKDNRITELESQIEELKKSHQVQEEQYKAELQKQIDDLNATNEEMASKVIELEKYVKELENEKGELAAKLTTIETETPKEDDRVQKLTKELDELNKSMIKLKAQHKNKLKNVQKQIENFKKVSDTNAELVKLANQVALLEEEKASANEWQERIGDLEGKVTAQTKEIEAHIEAIAILENQKLDLMQELHVVKQEVSSLEAENAESENLRVSAEMKVVDLEEQLETLQRSSHEDPERVELQRQLEALAQENERLSQKVLKLEELKPSSDVGSTESFVKTGSNVDSTESFEALAADGGEKADLLRKIDGLTRENGALLEKLTRFEEKGSSDTGSTESFERIAPEHANEAGSRLEVLTRENYELVIRLTKLEERLNDREAQTAQLNAEIEQLREKLALTEAADKPQEVVEEVKVREVRSVEAQQNLELVESTESAEPAEIKEELPTTEDSVTPAAVPAEDAVNVEELLAKIESLTILNENLSTSLQELEKEKAELAEKLLAEKAANEEPTKEIDAASEVTVTGEEEKLSEEKEIVAQKLEEEQAVIALETPAVESSPLIEDDKPCGAEDLEVEAVKANEATIAALEAEMARCNLLINEQKESIEELRGKLAEKEAELEQKSAQIASDSEACDLDVRGLRRELEDSESAIAEWRAKCADTEAKLEALEVSKRQIEEGFHALQSEHKNLLEESERKDQLVGSLKEELESITAGFEARLREQADALASQEGLVHELRNNLEIKEQELQAKYTQLQSDLVKMDELQEELNKLEAKVQQRDATIASLTEEVETLRTNASLVEEDLFVARHQLSDLHDKLENSKSVEEYNQLVERLHDKEMLVEELESKIANRVAEINTLKSQTESLEAENHQMRQRLEEEEHRVADLLEGNRSQEEALQDAQRAKAEVENRLLDLQTTHEENLRQARSIGSELQDTYKLMEQLKLKHTEDIEMLNRRLEDSLEELQAKAQEISSLQSELDQKNSAIAVCVPEEVKSNLEAHVTELEQRLAEAETKLQTQLEKMKKYAAVAKKKSLLCEELEGKFKELEEKYGLEVSEREARSNELQESQARIQEKDNRITEIEEELQRAQNQRDEAFSSLEAVKIELAESKAKLNSLNDELQELNEVKERARELGVRMEVMETEYVEQLGQINSLKTENGLLLSKQAQINERLENVEKESEERREKLEKLEKEREIEEARRTETQEICSQCTTRVQALEAKLQERDAEIENLDNELHNSIGNLVQMQENLRLSTISAVGDSPLQESYNELSAQHTALAAASEETHAKYEAALRNNRELEEHVARLQELDATARARIEELERELARDRESAAGYETLHAQYVELLERYEKQKPELETSQAELREALEVGESAQHELRSRIEQLERDKQSLSHECDQLKITRQEAVEEEGWGLEPTSSVLFPEAMAQQSPANETFERQKRDVADEAPPLFDASVFGEPQKTSVSAELEMEIGRLREEVSALNKQVELERSAGEEVQARLNSEIQSLRTELDALNTKRFELEAVIEARDKDLEYLRNEVTTVNEALTSARAEHDKLSQEMEQKNSFIIGALNEKESSLGQLEQLNHEKQEIERIISNLLFGTPGVNESASIVQKLHNLEIKYNELLSELEAVKNDNAELTAAQEVYKTKIVQFEIEAKTSGDNAVIAELESRIARVVSERDILQLQVNDVTRAYEELKETVEGLKSLQSQFEAVKIERNQLAEELAALRANQETKIEKREVQQSEAAAPEPKVEDLVESMWENDEDPWGFNDRNVEQHIDIPVVPSAEIQLKLKVDELEEKLKELTEENAKLIEEGKLAQVKNVKYVKKLKEYKVQFDSLQRELKSQRSMGGFGDLDSAIEEELKAQMGGLEKALTEAKEEIKKLNTERDGLLRRIEVLTAATDRFTEAKEKQDTEVHIWQMRYKELEAKLQQLDFGPETRDKASSPPQQASLDLDPQREAELKELRENMDALAAENEELQQLLEEHRTKRQAAAKETDSQIQELQGHVAEHAAANEKLKADYDSLRRQYEQSLMDANDQVQSMRQNCDILKAEIGERAAEAEKTQAELGEQLRAALEEKAQLETKAQELEQSLLNANDEAQNAKQSIESASAEFAERSRGYEASIAELQGKLQAAVDEKAVLESKVQSLQACTGTLNSTSSSLDEVTVLLNVRAQEIAALQEELQKRETENSQLHESARTTVQQLTEALSGKEAQLSELTAELRAKNDELARQKEQLDDLQSVVDKVNGLELSIEGYTTEVQEKNEKIRELEEKLATLEAVLSEKEQVLTVRQSQLEKSANEVEQCTTRVQAKQDLADRLLECEKREQEIMASFAVRDADFENTVQEVDQLRLQLINKQAELENVEKRLDALVQQEDTVERTDFFGIQESVKKEEEVPVFTFASDNDNDQELRRLKALLKTKDDEIEHLHYSLSESTTTRMLQELQDNVNKLYNEKSQLEEQVAIKNQEIHGLKAQLEGHPPPQSYQGRRKRSIGEPEEITKLHDELFARDQQIADLRRNIAEAESQLRTALDQKAIAETEAESRLRELYDRKQELESLKFSVGDLQSEIANLRGVERLAAEDRATIERLKSEKESVRLEAEEAVQHLLKEKELEMETIRSQLAAENQGLMEALGLRERDLENLRLHMEQSGQDRNHIVEQSAEQAARLEAELSERDRRLAELSITKDAEIHNLRVQLSEKNARLEELTALGEEEARQLAELRMLLEMREQQINGLMQQLDEKSKEYDLIQSALQRHVPRAKESEETPQLQSLQQSSSDEARPNTEKELDLALYMLHQRDVRCEELALELTQLVDERDTLQLRLSNALRVNEELKKYAPSADSSLQREPTAAGASTSGHPEAEPLVENPSPSRSEGPVEIAKEALGENKKALAQKLSQLKSVDQRRDVRLKDDQEQRYSQQMRLLAHKDVLSKLPPEAAARLVNANYTLSRDVQSQSSVLMNWLWGKSTPKVMHM